ncbi:MAG: metallophosphoesterase [Deltaproteobacteria bacterium]|nr:metallophosphoesterase [Deltaproteobacteria bacterium]
MRLIHLSDVHVQIDYASLPLRRYGWRRAVAQLEWVGLRRAQRFHNALGALKQIVHEIQELRPDHVLLTGDLTALAVEEEFACARAALEPIARPGLLTVIPGNHDRYTSHAMAGRRFERHFADLLRSDLPAYPGSRGYPFVRLVGGELAVIGLDSTRLAPVPGLSFGSVGGEQRRALARLLDDPAVRDRWICVLVHHAPLHRSGRPDRVSHGLLDGGELLRMLAGRRCTLHHGHVHHRFWHRAVPGRPDVFDAGSSTERGHEGYWLMDLLPDGRLVAEERTPRTPPQVDPCPVTR